jgi:hypothetical protein
MTINQIALVEFNAVDTARQRLKELFRLRLVDRFRPYRPHGKEQFHYLLGELGAHLIAAENGLSEPKAKWRADSVAMLAKHVQLAHMVGVSGFVASLLGAQRQGHGRLVEWRTTQQCIEAWGDDIRPDGYGYWCWDDGALPFFLEYDRGTESLNRVVSKLDGYARLLSKIGSNAPVLFVFENFRREVNFRKLVRDRRSPSWIATTTKGTVYQDQVWLLVDDRQRVTLSDIASQIVRRNQSS